MSSDHARSPDKANTDLSLSASQETQSNSAPETLFGVFNPRRSIGTSRLTGTQILSLQRMLGNQGVQRLLNRSTLKQAPTQKPAAQPVNVIPVARPPHAIQRTSDPKLLNPERSDSKDWSDSDDSLEENIPLMDYRQLMETREELNESIRHQSLVLLKALSQLPLEKLKSLTHISRLVDNIPRLRFDLVSILNKSLDFIFGNGEDSDGSELVIAMHKIEELFAATFLQPKLLKGMNSVPLLSLFRSVCTDHSNFVVFLKKNGIQITYTPPTIPENIKSLETALDPITEDHTIAEDINFYVLQTLSPQSKTSIQIETLYNICLATQNFSSNGTRPLKLCNEIFDLRTLALSQLDDLLLASPKKRSELYILLRASMIKVTSETMMLQTYCTTNLNIGEMYGKIGQGIDIIQGCNIQQAKEKVTNLIILTNEDMQRTQKLWNVLSSINGQIPFIQIPEIPPLRLFTPSAQIGTPVKSHEVSSVTKSSSGSVGVYFFNTNDGMIAIKASDEPLPEGMANNLAKLLNLPIPAFRVLEDILEISGVEQILKEKGTKLDEEHLTFAMEFIQGSDLDKLDYETASKIFGGGGISVNGKKQLQAMGKTFAFDLLICNVDRFPMPHKLRSLLNLMGSGNTGNVRFSSKGEFRPIDQVIGLKAIKEHGDEYIGLVIETFINIIEMNSPGYLALEGIAGMIHHSTGGFEIEDEGIEEVKQGVIQGLKAIILLDVEHLLPQLTQNLGLHKDDLQKEDLNLILKFLKLMISKLKSFSFDK